MITLKLSSYTEKEKRYLRHIFLYSQHNLLPCIKDCDVCDFKHVCYDIDSVLPYIHSQVK